MKDDNTKIGNQAKMFTSYLRLAVCAELRKNILLNLFNNAKSLNDLRSELKIDGSNARHALSDLEDSNFVIQSKTRKYLLTNIGRIITLKLIDFIDTIITLKENESFWLDHDLSGIPDHLLEKIAWLKDSDIIQINVLDIIKTHSVYTSSIQNANWINGVSPIYSPDYPHVFKPIIEKNVKTKLILTEPVLNKLTDDISLQYLKNLMYDHHLEIFVTDQNLKVAFTVTDTFFTLSLFTNTGVYDTAYDLNSTDERGIRWGIKLFEYYLKKSKKYEI